MNTSMKLLLSLAFVGSTGLVQSEVLLPLPPVKQSGDVSYVSGGVPDEQLPAIQKAKASYPLVIELYQKSGANSEYTADAQVRLKNSKGDVVLDDKADGPFFLVRTAPGTYQVEATLNGKTVTQRGVAVPAKGSRRVVIVFPQATD